MMKLEVLVEHENEFGDERLKKVGTTYEASPLAGQALVANGYAKDVDGVLTPETKPDAPKGKGGTEKEG